jgi:hypothetical protein
MEKIIKYPHPNFRDKTGEKHITSQGYKIEIIECNNSHDCTVKFEDDFIINNLHYSNIKKGNIKNPYHPSVHGIGYLGEGVYKAHIGKTATKCYLKWNRMLQRCYDKKYQEKKPTYKEVSVCEEWHNFQNFAKWYEDNYNPETMQGWHLDKDILVKRNKVYSPETCCFVPQEINALFLKSQNKRGTSPVGVFNTVRNNKYTIGITLPNGSKSTKSYDTAELAFEAYKNTKENYIKEVADKWKDQIDLRVYQAMYNYKVEITD